MRINPVTWIILCVVPTASGAAFITFVDHLGRFSQLVCISNIEGGEHAGIQFLILATPEPLLLARPVAGKAAVREKETVPKMKANRAAAS